MTGAVAGGRRRQVVGVMGSGVERHDALAGAVGTWIARQGFHLLTGGGEGVMAAVSTLMWLRDSGDMPRVPLNGRCVRIASSTQRFG